MEDKDSKWVEGSMVESVKKQADYPRHEQPVDRSEMHNKIRLIIGRVLMLVFGGATLISGAALIFFLFAVCNSLFSDTPAQIPFVQQLMTVVIPLALFLMSKGSFRWARHLTRLDSKEFV
ncbi:MAG: hypothetical protein V7785_21885 [Bermanella sp.]